MVFALLGQGNFLKSLTIWFGTFQTLLFIVSGNAREDLRNYLNIISVKDHSENIGLFWYLFVELFKQHVEFYRVLYLLFFTVLGMQIVLNLNLFIKTLGIDSPNSLDPAQATSKRVVIWSLSLSIYVSTILIKAIAARDTLSLPLPLRAEFAAARSTHGLQTLPEVCGRTADHGLRLGLLPAEHALHVDHLDRQALGQRQLLLLPDDCVPTVSFSDVRAALREC